MQLAPYVCLVWLSTNGLGAVQAEDSDTDVSMRSSHPHRGLAPANTDFAFTLYKQLVASAPGENTVFSPVSISMALAMLSLGTCGVTRTQLLQGLGFNLTETSEANIHQAFKNLSHLLGESDTSLEMTMGNALFLDHSLQLLESFSADIKSYYESEALATDFQDLAKAKRQINEYVKNKTQGNIVDFFSKLDEPVLLILVNYIFFKGTWEHPFDPNSTKEGDFHLSGTSTVKVPMMSQSGTMKYLNDTVLPCQLVQLDYMGNGTIFFILPDKGEMDTVIDAVDRDTIQRWSHSLISGQVDLSIPKVSISRAYDLGDVLGDMDIADLLTSQANFSGIMQETQMKVSKVVHKAALRLEEKGVVPAATPGGAQRLEAPPVSIKFNWPFLVMIFDRFTWSSLFLGKIVNPIYVQATQQQEHRLA